MQNQQAWKSYYLSKMLLLALLYVATGKLGLLLAVPPGYATMIWPPSGIAVGMLLLHGRRLWPGVLLGSFVLNCYVSNAVALDGSWVDAKLIAAFGIAIGSTLQAVFGAYLVRKYLGLPLRLNSVREMVRLFLLCGPFACVVAASIGVGILYHSGIVPLSMIASNWLTWWTGDVFGVLVFLPLLLVAPGSKRRLVWRDKSVSALPALAMLVLLVPLGLTFYGWKIASLSSYHQGEITFENVAFESEKALQTRMGSYQNALLGAAGFVLGSENISANEWAAYIDTLSLQKNFPGIRGIGLVSQVESNAVQAHEKAIRRNGQTNFSVHPETQGLPQYIIDFVEPKRDNWQAIGLNIAFETHRRAAADLSRDSGKPAITKNIPLVQDVERKPGFLLLHPMYQPGQAISTKAQRREAFRGWIYAPFVARDFLSGLTRSQGSLMNLRIYDGDTPDAARLIYATNQDNISARTPAHEVSKVIHVMQQPWLLVWSSTTAFERVQKSDNALVILVGGLLFTGLFGLFLMLAAVRRTETIEKMFASRTGIVPIFVFVVVLVGTGLLFRTMQKTENASVHSVVEVEANKVLQLMNYQINDKLRALKRLAVRWEVGGGTPLELWQVDAANYTKQLGGLKAVEWVDASYHIRRVEPLAGNEMVMGMNVAFDKTRTAVLKGAAAQNTPTLTQPLDLLQGYKGMIAYIPLLVENRFDGFMVGVISINEFFSEAFDAESKENFEVSLRYEGKEFFNSEDIDKDTIHLSPKNEAAPWSIERKLRLYDKEWTVNIRPKQGILMIHKTILPTIILLAGALIAMLSALMVHYVFMARLKSAYLLQSNSQLEEKKEALAASDELYDLAVKGMSVGVWSWEVKDDVLFWSPRLREIFGMTDPNEQPTIAYFSERLHPDDKERVMGSLKGHLDNQTPYDEEYRFLRPDGSYVWIHASGQAKWDAEGNPLRMAGSAVDIEERKRIEKQIEESRAFLKLIMNNIPDLLFVKDADLRIVEANKAFLSLYPESKRHEIIGTTTLEDYTQAEVELFTEKDREALREGISTAQEVVAFPNNEGTRVLDTTKVRFENSEGAKFILGISRDMTEQQKLVEQLLASNTELERFAYVASHDMQEPLRMITSFSEIIADDYGDKLDAEGIEYLHLVKDAGLRMRHMIDDLLDYARIGHDNISHVLVDANKEIGHVLENLTPLIAERKSVITHDPLPSFLGNPMQFMRLLQNLITNGMKYQAPDSIPAIHVGVEAEARFWHFTVKDNGLGIDPKFLEHVFQPFRRLHGWNEIKGSGIGLAVCKKIVENHGGTIWATSQPGDGSVFHFTIAKTIEDWTV